MDTWTNKLTDSSTRPKTFVLWGEMRMKLLQHILISLYATSWKLHQWADERPPKLTLAPRNRTRDLVIARLTLHLTTSKLCKRVENIVGKQKLLVTSNFSFSQCFQKACFPGASKGVIVWEWVKWDYVCKLQSQWCDTRKSVFRPHQLPPLNEEMYIPRFRQAIITLEIVKAMQCDQETGRDSCLTTVALNNVLQSLSLAVYVQNKYEPSSQHLIITEREKD